MSNEIHYTPHFEKLLKDEAEKAESMSILHSKAYIKYNRLSVITNIPVIILSAFVGFFNPVELFPKQTLLLGILSVCIGIIKTIDSYMDFTKRTQTHYLTSLSYKKISKTIQVQLSLEKQNRISPRDLLTIITNDLNNIADSEPVIPTDVINEFKKQYGHEETAKAPICNGLTKVQINPVETREIFTQTENENDLKEIHIEVKPIKTNKKIFK